MKKIIFIILLIGFKYQVLSQTRITGKIDGISSKVETFYLTLAEDRKLKIIDSCKVYNDSFEFHVRDTEPKIYTAVSLKDLSREPKGFLFWVDTNDIIIKGSIEYILLNKELTRQEAMLQNLCSRLEVRGSMNQLLMQNLLKDINDDLVRYFQLGNRSFLKSKGKSPRQVIREKIMYKTERFISKHNDQSCSAFLLFWLGRMEHIIQPKDAKKLMSLLTERIQHSYYADLYNKAKL